MLQHEIDKRPYDIQMPTYIFDVGKYVQRIFEIYFKNEINLRPAGQSVAVLLKLADRVLTAPTEDLHTTYWPGQSREKLEAVVRECVEKGFTTLQELKLLDRKTECEVPETVMFPGRRLGLYAQLDFKWVYKDHVRIMDGKSSKDLEKNATDERQLLFYALVMRLKGFQVADSGFLYYRHTFKPVDTSSAAIRTFLDGDFDRGYKIFEQLYSGVMELEATPSKEVCGDCRFRLTCSASVLRTVPLPDDGNRTMELFED
jgi:hypothetical protein